MKFSKCSTKFLTVHTPTTATMSPTSVAVAARSAADAVTKLDSSQTLRASTALLRKIHSDEIAKKETSKANLLEDADDADEAEDETPVWLILTTKKHIVDKKRLKPGKIVLPHPYLTTAREGLRICLITADPQQKYKDLIAQSGFPLPLAAQVKRVIGMEKIKSKYKSYESRRQLLSEYDVFLADDRVATYLPKALGKPFFKGGSKRPVPVSLEGKRQSVDEQGNKRRKLAEGGSKVVKSEVRAEDVAKELERALSSALIHLAPSTTTAVKVGVATQTPEQVQDNIDAVVAGLVEKYVPQQWKNVRSVHIKGPNTAALPVWLTDELWEDSKDVLEEAPKANEGKKRKRGALNDDAADVIEVPGPDGKMRRLEKSSTRKIADAQTQPAPVPAKKPKNKPEDDDDADARAVEKAEKAARKKTIKEQKEAARADTAGTKSKNKSIAEPVKLEDASTKKSNRKAQSKA